MKKTIVVARYKEDMKWLSNIPPDINKSIIQKGEHLENKGREPSSFIYYILEHYDTLEGTYYFVQGNPFDHCPDLRFQLLNNDDRLLGNKKHVSDGYGRGAHPGLAVKEVYEYILDKKFPDKVEFVAGGQFCVSADTIKKHPKEFYQKCYDILIQGDVTCYIFERIWGSIFFDI